MIAPLISLRSMMGAALVLAASAGVAAAEDVVHIGMARSVSNGAELIAIEKGYFKEAGIKVEIEDIDTSANTIALLATEPPAVRRRRHLGRLFQCAREEPADHHHRRPGIDADRPQPDAAARPQGQGHEPRRTSRARSIASNGAGSVSTYEVGKMLETAGLQIADVDVKIFPFTQMALAFANKAIDAAIVIPPFVSEFLDQRLCAWRSPSPTRSSSRRR